MLDPESLNSLKVVDLRKELQKRNLDSKGVKAILVARLKEALLEEEEDDDEVEEEAEESSEAPPPPADEVKICDVQDILGKDESSSRQEEPAQQTDVSPPVTGEESSQQQEEESSQPVTLQQDESSEFLSQQEESRQESEVNQDEDVSADSFKPKKVEDSQPQNDDDSSSKQFSEDQQSSDVWPHQKRGEDSSFYSQDHSFHVEDSNAQDVVMDMAKDQTKKIEEVKQEEEKKPIVEEVKMETENEVKPEPAVEPEVKRERKNRWDDPTAEPAHQEPDHRQQDHHHYNNDHHEHEHHDRKRRRSPSPESREEYKSQQENIQRQEDEPEYDEQAVLLSWYDSDLHLQIDKANMFSATPLTEPNGFGYIWAGVRANYGFMKGKVYYEFRVTEDLPVKDLEDEPNPNVARCGWSVNTSSLQLGEDPLSYGYGGTGKISTNCKFQDYGKPFVVNDVVGCYLDFTSSPIELSYSVNGEHQGVAYRVSEEEVKGKALFPHILTKNCKIEVNFGQSEPWATSVEGYTNVGKVPIEDRVPGFKQPEKRENCEVIMMIGLPASGKTTWANKHADENQDKHYNILGTNQLIDKMKVMGLPRRRNYAGRWQDLITKCTECLNKQLDIAAYRRRNFILDQTNVYPTAQKRKIRGFEGFLRKAVIIVPTDEEFKDRTSKREADEGKDVPDHAVLDMKANFQLPPRDLFDEIIYPELPEEEAKQLIQDYLREAEDAGVYPNRQNRRFRDDRRDSRDYRGGRDSRDRNYHNRNYDRYPPRGGGSGGPPRGRGGPRGGYRDRPYDYDRGQSGWRGPSNRYGSRDSRGGSGGRGDRREGGGRNDRDRSRSGDSQSNRSGQQGWNNQGQMQGYNQGYYPGWGGGWNQGYNAQQPATGQANQAGQGQWRGYQNQGTQQSQWTQQQWNQQWYTQYYNSQYQQGWGQGGQAGYGAYGQANAWAGYNANYNPTAVTTSTTGTTSVTAAAQPTAITYTPSQQRQS